MSESKPQKSNYSEDYIRAAYKVALSPANVHQRAGKISSKDKVSDSSGDITIKITHNRISGMFSSLKPMSTKAHPSVKQ